MNEKDKIIARIQKQLKEMHSKCNAQEDEIAVLKYEIRLLRKVTKTALI